MQEPTSDVWTDVWPFRLHAVIYHGFGGGDLFLVIWGMEPRLRDWQVIYSFPENLKLHELL